MYVFSISYAGKITHIRIYIYIYKKLGNVYILYTVQKNVVST